MKREDLIDIDESLLPDVSLSIDQKNKIQKAININLNYCIEYNHDLQLDTSLTNIFNIYSSLGPERDKTIHLTRYAKVLQKLVLDAFNKKYAPPENELLCSMFLNKGAGLEYVETPPYWGDTPFYAQIYITKDMLYIYYFSNVFKLTSKREVLLSNIECAYLSSISEDNTQLSHENLIIQLPDSNKVSTKLYFVSENPNDTTDIKLVLETLLHQGIKNYTPSKKHLSQKLLPILWIIISIILCIQTILTLMEIL